MFRGLSHIYNFTRTGLMFARSDLMTEEMLGDLPVLLRQLVKLARIGVKPDKKNLSALLQGLGPSHIKLGQFLATRPDIIGPDLAEQLSELQDRLPPFAQDKAIAEIERSLGKPIDELYAQFDKPIAAASIAQVHKARIKKTRGKSANVAVKVLRPGIERRLANDIEGFRFAARMIERFSKSARRLRPSDAVEILAQSIKIELDLRLEAAAISEMAKNTEKDNDFRVPEIDWTRTSKRILTIDWIDGVPISDIEALKAAGHDLPKLSAIVMQSFLRHAMRDGFFHADMHPGNLFIDKQGRLVAVDLGIMGRLEPKDRLFLAEILYGFTTRNYKRVADVHFSAGYVPAGQSPEMFAQALRAIGEPIMDKNAKDISMARLLAQLFQVTEQFDMKTQPQLLLLQKTMVVVEGVARLLDPDFNMWVISEPVVKEWLNAKLGPEGRIAEVIEGASTLGRLMTSLPETMAKFERVSAALDDLPANKTNGGNMQNFSPAAIWVGAGALCLIALALLF